MKVQILSFGDLELNSGEVIITGGTVQMTLYHLNGRSPNCSGNTINLTIISVIAVNLLIPYLNSF